MKLEEKMKILGKLRSAMSTALVSYVYQTFLIYILL
jgi:hypothetical protein